MGTPASPDPPIPSPRLVATWEKLGLLPAEKVPLWAAHWIAGGHDGEALVELAGLRGDDPQDVHDLLPAALADCGVEIPDSHVAAANLAFTHVATMQAKGLGAARWVAQQVDQIVAMSEYSQQILDLPLGRLYGLDDEWGTGWGRPVEELVVIVRQACDDQLSSIADI